MIEAIRRATTKPLNVHLMMVEPERMLEDFVKAGADHLLVQCEPASTIHLHRVLSRIRELGCKAGVVIDPGSPIAFVENVLHLCDVVLVMTVNPGFGGQKFLPEVLPKITALRRLCDTRGLNPYIEVDGGQNGDNAWQAVDAGADALVAGLGGVRLGRLRARHRAAARACASRVSAQDRLGTTMSASPTRNCHERAHNELHRRYRTGRTLGGTTGTRHPVPAHRLRDPSRCPEDKSPPCEGFSFCRSAIRARRPASSAPAS